MFTILFHPEGESTVSCALLCVPASFGSLLTAPTRDVSQPFPAGTLTCAAGRQTNEPGNAWALYLRPGTASAAGSLEPDNGGSAYTIDAAGTGLAGAITRRGDGYRLIDPTGRVIAFYELGRHARVWVDETLPPEERRLATEAIVTLMILARPAG